MLLKMERLLINQILLINPILFRMKVQLLQRMGLSNMEHKWKTMGLGVKKGEAFHEEDYE